MPKQQSITSFFVPKPNSFRGVFADQYTNAALQAEKRTPMLHLGWCFPNARPEDKWSLTLHRAFHDHVELDRLAAADVVIDALASKIEQGARNLVLQLTDPQQSAVAKGSLWHIAHHLARRTGNVFVDGLKIVDKIGCHDGQLLTYVDIEMSDALNRQLANRHVLLLMPPCMNYKLASRAISQLARCGARVVPLQLGQFPARLPAKDAAHSAGQAAIRKSYLDNALLQSSQRQFSVEFGKEASAMRDVVLVYRG